MAGSGTATATIAAGASLSDAIDIGPDETVVRLIMPGVWTAAVLTLQASHDGTTYCVHTDRSGNEYTITAAASKSIGIPPADLIGVRFLKLQSGTSGAVVNQAAARSIIVCARRV